ncbi:MAG: hypothetical protein HY731_08090 [Candidatus Tectomicrobia bacterium]|nr:hypothetical protein [Candidatus Tectomicrobia bacterium]
MEQHTTTQNKGATWLEMAAETWAALSRDGVSLTGDQFAHAFAARLGMDREQIASWMQGVEVLAASPEAALQAVESTNDHVTGARLKLAGRRWSEQGAVAMARLRTDLFHGIWEARTRQ